LYIDIFTSIYFRNTAKIFFVSTSLTKNLNGIYDFLLDIGSLHNMIFIRNKTFIANPITREIFVQRDSFAHFSHDALFPDILKDMKNFGYGLVAFDQYPRIKFSKLDKHVFRSVDIFLFYEIVKHQNAQIVLKLLPSSWSIYRLIRYTEDRLDLQKSDLSLNTIFSSANQSYRRFVNAFDENGYSLTFIHFLLTPFDVYAWTLMVLSIIACAIVCH
jgi:hypothetical protein